MKNVVGRRMSEEEIEYARDVWNTFAMEWNRREFDPEIPLPSCGDDWCPINTVLELHRNANTWTFKADPTNTMYRLFLRRGFDWTRSAKPLITRADVLRGWIYFDVSYSPLLSTPTQPLDWRGRPMGLGVYRY